jgi:glycerate 2-kinase
MRILIAPDKFKDSLAADVVAEAMMRGARLVHPDASFVLRPIADGGEGTLDAFVLASGGRVRNLEVSGPLDAAVISSVAMLQGGEAVVESAGACGLSLLSPSPESALEAHTFGVGQLILFAADSGAPRVTVGVGGTSSTDGGTGAARAAGWRFLDDSGEEIPLGGRHLELLHTIEPPQASIDVQVVAACDVDSTLLGADGAANVFAPQKGADGSAVETLERGLIRLAQVVARDLSIDIARLPHGGAGGGLGAGLAAFFGATLRAGLELLAESTDIEREIASCDLVLTGEGRLDRASLSGKAPIAVARLAAKHHTPCIAIAGDLQLEKPDWKRNGIESAVGLRQSGGEALAETEPAMAIEKAVEGVLRHRVEKKQGRSLRR